jgi:hypothetical protein
VRQHRIALSGRTAHGFTANPSGGLGRRGDDDREGKEVERLAMAWERVQVRPVREGEVSGPLTTTDAREGSAPAGTPRADTDARSAPLTYCPVCGKARADTAIKVVTHCLAVTSTTPPVRALILNRTDVAIRPTPVCLQPRLGATTTSHCSLVHPAAHIAGPAVYELGSHNGRFDATR